MEGFVGEHGSILVSGLIAVASILVAAVLIYGVGEMNYLSTVSVIGG